MNTDSHRLNRGRKILKVLAVIAVCLIVIIVLLPKLIPTGWISDLVIEEIKNRLNREAEIESVSLGWFKGVSINGLTIYERGSSQEPFVRLKRLELRATIFGLIAKPPEIKKIILVEPEVFVTRYKDGRYNFSDLVERRTEAENGATLLVCLPAQLPPHILHTPEREELKVCVGQIPPIFVQNATVHYQDQVTHHQLKIGHLNISFTPSSENKRDYRFAINWLIIPEMVSQGEVEIKGDITNLFNENMKLNKGATVNALVKLRRVDPEATLLLFNITPPDISTAPLNGTINLETQGRRKVLLSGELELGNLIYTPVPTQGVGIPIQVKSIKLIVDQVNWDTAEPWKESEKIDFQGRLDIDRVNYGDIELKELAVPLRFANNHLSLKALEGILNQGKMQADIEVDFSEVGILGKAKCLIKQAGFSDTLTNELVPSLRTLINQIKITQVGTTFSTEFDLSVWGMEKGDFKKSLSGKGEIVISRMKQHTKRLLRDPEATHLGPAHSGEGGQFQGTTVLKLLAKELNEPRLAQMKFDRIKQVFEIKNERIYNHSTDFFGKEANLHFKGWIGFNGQIEQVMTLKQVQGELAGRWGEKTTRILKAINESGGLKIRGTIHKPTIDSDLNKLLREKTN